MNGLIKTRFLWSKVIDVLKVRDTSNATSDRPFSLAGRICPPVVIV